jgi:hypothetical protein
MRLALSCAAAAALLAIASAPTLAADDDIAKQIISSPSPLDFTVYGQGCSGEVRKDPDVQGGKALRAHIPGKSANPWDCGLSVPITKPVKKGDQMVLAFWARLIQGENGATTATLPNNSVQMAQAPYNSVLSGSTQIDGKWTIYSVTGVADRDYKAGEINASFHLATAKQVIDFGPVFVLDRGQ